MKTTTAPVPFTYHPTTGAIVLRALTSGEKRTIVRTIIAARLAGLSKASAIRALDAALGYMVPAISPEGALAQRTWDQSLATVAKADLRAAEKAVAA